MKKIVLSSLLMGFSSLAIAHPGHGLAGSGLESAYAGFMHPLTGWDHLLVMLAVGLWAGKISGRARWQLPLTFMIFMLLGAILGMTGLMFAGLETAVAASVMAMGLVLIISFSINYVLRIGVVGIFAILHGMAHGSELNLQQGLFALCGMLIATGLLHGIGLLIGSQRLYLAKWPQSALAWGIMLAGGYMLVAA
jgi:urease accessory protein